MSPQNPCHDDEVEQGYVRVNAEGLAAAFAKVLQDMNRGNGWVFEPDPIIGERLLAAIQEVA